MMFFLRPASSLAPKACETGIAKPLQTPMQNPIMRKFMQPVAPTPARALKPRNRPTIMVSTRL